MSALLDGQLPSAESEAAWTHVHQCVPCRELVEREGWVKTRLAGLSLQADDGAPDRLKGALLRAHLDSADPHHPLHPPHRARRVVGFAALGGGAVGAAMMGILAVGALPAATPSTDRRVPTSQTPVPVSHDTTWGPERRVGPGGAGVPVSGPTPIRLVGPTP